MNPHLLSDLWIFMAGLWVSTLWSHTEHRSFPVRLLMALIAIALWPAFQVFWCIDRVIFLYRRYYPHRRSFP